MNTEETTADRFAIDPSARSAGLSGLAKRRPHEVDSTTPPALHRRNLDDVPDPDLPAGEGALTPADQADLATCTTLLRDHHAEYWVTGKAIDAIRQRRLYRTTHDTYEAFLTYHDISTSDAHRMTTGWRLARALLVTHPTLSRSHVEALHPILATWGLQAAVTLYGRMRTEYTRLTAADIRKVVRQIIELVGEQEEIDSHTETAIEAAQKETPRESKGQPAIRTKAKILAKEIGRDSMTSKEVTDVLSEAFLDAEDDRVYVAVRQWMKAKKSRK